MSTVKSHDRIRIVVTGNHGQLVNALRERASVLGVDVIPVGRPILDLNDGETILPALEAARPHAIVNAASFTAVEQAETQRELAHQINAVGAGEVAAAANHLDVPVVHLSTDYVFDGQKTGPYVESDPVRPLNIYGQSKAEGEFLVAAHTGNYVILRTSWIYSPFGANFVRTILRLARTKQALNIVADQHGAPTSALDLASGIVTVVRNLVFRPEETALRGMFHMTAAGEASWAELGEAVFNISRNENGPFATVRHIASKDYPQRAKRPSNSRLDCSRIAKVHGVRLPDWRSSLDQCVKRLVATGLET